MGLFMLSILLDVSLSRTIYFPHLAALPAKMHQDALHCIFEVLGVANQQPSDCEGVLGL
jgi:hypothetical protein